MIDRENCWIKYHIFPKSA